MPDYKFTNDWFVKHRPLWDKYLPAIDPRDVLEIGSFEGQSACYMIETLGARHPFNLTCVDTFEGGIEHKPGGESVANMAEVEERFHFNVNLAMQESPEHVSLDVRKGDSNLELCKLLAEGKSESFDFVFVDGSHVACDVLADAIHAFHLLKVGGVIVFDDYLWQEKLPYGVDPLRSPKMAVDSFTTIFARKLQLIQAPLYQFFVRKVAS